MKITDVRKKAKAVGLTPGKKTKEQLIREIQRAEGNRDCFNRERRTCGQVNCAWRQDCK